MNNIIVTHADWLYDQSSEIRYVISLSGSAHEISAQRRAQLAVSLYTLFSA